MSDYKVLECEATGHGYDLKLKFRVDDELRFLYYAEMPDRNFVRGWNVYEISSENYEANQKEPCIRYIGSFSGDNQYRANAFVAQALREGRYVQSKWDVYYGDIYLVKEIKKDIPKLEFTEKPASMMARHTISIEKCSLFAPQMNHLPGTRGFMKSVRKPLWSIVTIKTFWQTTCRRIYAI